MANNVKTYQIKINGIDESVKAVDALNKELSTLESRIKALEGKSVGVKSSGGGSTSSKSSLSEEEKIAKQIEQIDAKREAYSKEIYQNYLAAKDVLKETVKDQNAIAASERLQAKTYSNTIMGMKQKLADIKSAMQTVDLGDTDQLDKMTKRANELNDALKKIEESYGQFGRNVGNYATAADGFKKLTIEVNGVTRSFDNAKQALMTLKKERDTMGVGVGKTTKEFKELDEIVKTLQSDLKDLNKSSAAMDNLLDTMESLVAIASTAKGISALFGFDNTEIEKNIQKLVALQNILKGIETINKQIQTGEGIGGWIKPFNAQINTATTKLLAFNTALLGTGKAAKVAAVGIKTLSKAIKAIASLGLLLVVDVLMDAFDSLIEKFKEGDKELEKQKKYIEDTQGAYAKAAASINVYKDRVESFNGTKKQEKKLVDELNSEYGKSLGTYKTLAEWKKVLKERGEAYAKTMLKEAEAQALLNLYTEAFINLQKVQANVAAGEYHHWYQTVAGDREADAKAVDEANKKLAEAEKAYQDKMKEIDEFNKNNSLMNYAPQIEKNGKKNVDAVKEAEKELMQARLNSMKEGLNKTLTQLNEERKQRLAKLKENIKNYKELELQWNQFYDQKIIEAKEEWAKKIEKIYEDLWNKIYADSLENTKRIATLMNTSIENGRENMNKGYNKIFNQGIGSYGIQGKEQYSTMTQFSLGLVSSNKSQFIQDMKAEIDLMREAQTAENEYIAALRKFENEKNRMTDAELGRINLEIDQLENNYREKTNILNNYRSEMAQLYDDEQMQQAKQALIDENYTNNLVSMFKQRMSAVKAYWGEKKKFEINAANAVYSAETAVIQEQYSADTRAAIAHWNEMMELSDKHYQEEVDGIRAQEKAKLITHEEAERELREIEAKYNRDNTNIFNNYTTKMKALEEQFNQDMVKAENDRNNKIKQINTNAYQDRLQELRDFQTAISNLESRQPVMTSWGTTNLKATKENNKQLLASYEEMAEKINEERKNLNKDFKDGVIDKDVYESSKRELDGFAADIGDKMDNVKKELSDWHQIETFIRDAQQYVQAIGSTLLDIMQAVWSAQDAAFEREQEYIDKLNEELDKKLDEQEEIVQKHKDAIESIEDELATARGDRRQHLIDQINAEMAAQRAAAAQQKKLEKEKEALERKQDALELKRKKAEYKRNMAQAIVNGAMAVTMAAVNNWPMPAIAMMALAAASTAAQIATIASNKPYRVGGQLEGGLVKGKRHTQGGVPVGNTGIEVEGDEMIIRRESTMPNIDLLNYINKSQRKLDLGDFIDFYSSDKLKKNIISMSPKTRFAEGGILPTISNDYSFDDRLLSAFEDYSNRPVYVSVVDINNRQDAVKNVQVLAGLSD